MRVCHFRGSSLRTIRHWSRRLTVHRQGPEASYIVLPPCVPQPAPVALTPEQVFYRIAAAIDRHATAARVHLLFAARSAFQAASWRAEGQDRGFALAGLQVRRCLRDALCLQPAPPVPALCRAIEALLRGQLEAALGHLAQIESPAEVRT